MLNNIVTLPTVVKPHIQAINTLVSKIEHVDRKRDEYQRAIGQHIAAIKKARPNDWQAIVETECHLGRSRAYELLQIADGTKTIEQVRDQSSARQIKHRKAVRDVTDESKPCGDCCDDAGGEHAERVAPPDEAAKNMLFELKQHHRRAETLRKIAEVARLAAASAARLLRLLRSPPGT